MTATLSKTAREAGFLALWDQAEAAGNAAAAAAVPTPMVVGSPSTPLGSDVDPTKPMWFVADGVCGFAWVTVRPGGSSFARWLKATDRGRTSYAGGVSIWVSGFGQSYERKVAYAGAFAAVLRDAGVNATAGGRLD